MKIAVQMNQVIANEARPWGRRRAVFFLTAYRWRYDTQFCETALHVGRVVNTLGRLYKLDQPEPLEKAGMNLKAVGLEELKNLGL